MKTKKLVVASAAALLLMGASAVNAATMTLTLSSAVFNSGGTLTGTFDYNTDTNTYSNWSLVADLTNPPATSADPYTYAVGTSVIDNAQYITGFPTSASRVAFYANNSTDASLTGIRYRELNFKFDTALTAVTGDGFTLNLLATNPGASADEYYDGVGQTTVSLLNGGLITVSNYVPSTVPVPAAVWLFGTGLVGLMGFNRRKSGVAAAALSA